MHLHGITYGMHLSARHHLRLYTTQNSTTQTDTGLDMIRAEWRRRVRRWKIAAVFVVLMTASRAVFAVDDWREDQLQRGPSLRQRSST
jgi:hypothetical protein